MAHHLKRVERPEEWRAMHDIRRAVLFAPGRHAIAYDENHPDDRADGNTPFLFLSDNTPVGVARLDVRGEVAIVRLVAIVADKQRAGLGRAMDLALVAEARRHGVSLLRVNAAADAVGFYKKAGWHKADWDPAELTGLARDAVQWRRRSPASVGNPIFVSLWSSAMNEFRIRTHTSNPLNSSVVLDLSFLNVDAIQMLGTSNPPH